MVLLDYGHGIQTKDKEWNGFKEYKFNRAVGRVLELELTNRKIPYTVLVEGADDVSLRKRVERSEGIDHDLLVSIHGNQWIPDLRVRGIETYYHSLKGKQAADIMHKHLIRRLGWPDRGVKRSRFYILKNTPKPAILTENGFYTNEIESTLMDSIYWQLIIAEAHADAIQEIFEMWNINVKK